MNEQTVGWALHALEPDEEFEVLAHLAGCAECRALADDVAGVTADLAGALPQYEPPPGLRESIVERAARTPQVPPPAGHPGPAHPGPQRAAPGAPRHSLPGPAPDDAPQARPRRTGRVLVAAAVVLAVLVGGGVAGVQYQQMRAERDASTAQAQQMEDMLTLLARPGTSHAFLADPADPAARPVAALVLADGTRELMPMGLAPNSVTDQTYVLWGLDGDAQPTAVGTFDVRSDATGTMSVPSPESGTFSEYAVSLERGRHAPAAPTAVVAAGRVET